MVRLLLLSNSRQPGRGALVHARRELEKFLPYPSGPAVFIPYASVVRSYDEVADEVSPQFETLGWELVSIHKFERYRSIVDSCKAIIVGGGNTFKLLAELYRTRMLERIRGLVRAGTPYVGWSAGTNIAGPTIATCNSMPIVDVDSHEGLGLSPFHFNCHFCEESLCCRAGESRSDRIREFLDLHPEQSVLALPDGCVLTCEKNSISVSNQAVHWFRHRTGVTLIAPGQRLNIPRPTSTQ